MLYFSVFYVALASLESLTVDTFDAFIASNERVLVKFFAPWCGHCKAMAADYESAATQLEGKVALAEVDSTIHSELGTKYQVQGFPTLKYFNKGVMSDYDGGRKLDDILSWADEVTSPPISTETPPEPTTKPIIVLHAPELLKDFEAYAENNRKVGKFFHVVSSTTKITHQHPFEEQNELTSVDAESIAEFLGSNKMPLVGELNGDTFAAYSTSSLGLVWCLFPMEDGQLSAVIKQNMPLLQAVAKEVRGKFSITYTNTFEFASALEGMLDISSSDLPAIVVQKKAGSKQKFRYDGDMDAAKIVAYIEDVSTGKIVAKLKSEPIPETQGPVVQIVGENFKETVFLEDKDVLLEVYAPWCGHCKKLEPEYKTLAAKVGSVVSDHVVIAKMDGTANDAPEDFVDVNSFPTIVFIKAGSKEVDMYEGERSAKAMWKYIKENGNKKDEILAALNAHYATEEEHDEL